jgi:hypothetical protein
MSVMPIVGNIPENITYFSSSTKKLESYWENDSLHAGWVGQEVTPAFCSDTTNVKTMDTGRSWAEGGHWNQNKKPVKEKNIKNDPIKGIRIVSLEKRSEGGRAYKVVTPDNYYFDVREDVLMDTMIEEGIEKNGILNGSFVWARVGAEMKLVRVDSDLHKALVIATADRTLKKFGYGDLEVGHIYKGKSAECYLFLGYVDCSDCNCVDKTERLGIWGRQNSQQILQRTEIVNGLLLSSYSERYHQQHGLLTNLYTQVKTSHSFIKDLGTVPIPHDIIRIVAEKAYDEYIKDITNPTYIADIEKYKITHFCYPSKIITLRKGSTPAPAFPKYKDVLDRFTVINTIAKKV